MKTTLINKVQTLFLGGIGFTGGIILLSVDTMNTTLLTTFITLITGLTALVIGMYFLIEYAKLVMLPDKEEIDLMEDEELLDMMTNIENMEQLYFNHDPKMRLLYEELGEKVMEKYNKQYEEMNHVAG